MLRAPTHHLGAPTHVDGLTVFPVWTDAPIPRRALRTSLPDGARIGEVAEGPAIEVLRLQNPTEAQFLLPGGALFDGGWQHRVLIRSVLVVGCTEVDLDVRCVEAGRWGGPGDQRLHRRRAPLAIRGALGGIVHDQAQTPEQSADQTEVWNRVQRYEGTIGSSPSSSMLEIADHLDVAHPDVVQRLRPLPGQRGVLIGIGGHPVLLEVFDHPRTLAEQWEPIITGVLADARLATDQPTPSHRARSFIRRISARALAPCGPAGAAVAVHARDELVAAEGAAVEHDRLIHLSALNVRHELVGSA